MSQQNYQQVWDRNQGRYVYVPVPVQQAQMYAPNQGPHAQAYYQAYPPVPPQQTQQRVLPAPYASSSNMQAPANQQPTYGYQQPAYGQQALDTDAIGRLAVTDQHAAWQHATQRLGHLEREKERLSRLTTARKAAAAKNPSDEAKAAAHQTAANQRDNVRAELQSLQGLMSRLNSGYYSQMGYQDINWTDRASRR